ALKSVAHEELRICPCSPREFIERLTRSYEVRSVQLNTDTSTEVYE
ncbi:MAG: hypothetical protein ACI8W7_002607, partial [Gammaproteobacteria bacterium]